jgi:YbbR domain-containing protein
LALAIAVALWFVISVEKRETQRQKTVEASVSYDPPESMVILNPVQTVTVTLSGSDRQITSLNPFQVDVQVDLPDARPGPMTANLTAENVVRPPDLAVVSIKPSQLTLELDRELTVRLPVEPVLVGEPSAGATVGEVRVVPDGVQVSGPASLLEGIARLKTSPIRLDGHALDFEEVAQVVSPDPQVQVVQPSRVTVRVELNLSQPAAPAPREPGP